MVCCNVCLCYPCICKKCAIVAHNMIIYRLFYSIHRSFLNHINFHGFTSLHSLFLLIVWLLKRHCCSKKSPLIGQKRIKEHPLSLHSLLILQHLFIGVSDESHLVHRQLLLILKWLQASQHRQSVADLNVFLDDPGTKCRLALIASLLIVLVHPQHTCNHTCSVVH